MGKTGSLELNPSQKEFNDLKKTFSLTQDLNELAAPQRNQ